MLPESELQEVYISVLIYLVLMHWNATLVAVEKV